MVKFIAILLLLAIVFASGLTIADEMREWDDE